MSSPALARVQPLAKVYVRADLLPDDIRTRYSFLEPSFELVLKPDEAQFIVIDLDNPPEDIGEYLVMHLCSQAPLSESVAHIACFFIQAGQGTQKHRSAAVLAAVQSGLKLQPRICNSHAELLREMKWAKTQFLAGQQVAHRVIEYEKANSLKP